MEDTNDSVDSNDEINRNHHRTTLSAFSTGQTTEKIVTGNRVQKTTTCVTKELDFRHLDRRKNVPDYRILNCQGDVGMLGRNIFSSN